MTYDTRGVTVHLILEADGRWHRVRFRRRSPSSRDAFDGLGVDISLLRLEALGIMVHEAMTVQGRSFHTPEHIFNLADATNPVQALAALFHDVVYYEIDQVSSRRSSAS